ncbi:hypothetical protein ACGF1Z_04440 [Streptomyces sp. NPDC048018]
MADVIVARERLFRVMSGQAWEVSKDMRSAGVWVAFIGVVQAAGE